MAFDAGMLRAVVCEISGRLGAGAKVERVNQPAQDTVLLLLRLGGQTARLLIDAGTAMPRICLTGQNRENPAVPPMFCMLLRKHLAGARLTSIEQFGFERAARLTFSCYDEMGFPTERSLICEVMGKYSNLMLVDGSDKILAVLRPVDFSTSRKRQVLPGMIYELPPQQDKQNPLDADRASFLFALSACDPARRADKFLTDTYLGMAASIAREIVYRTVGRTDLAVDEMPPEHFADTFCLWMSAVREGNFSPCYVVRPNGEMVDYAYAPLTQYGDACVLCPDTATALDTFYFERDHAERIRRRAADLLSLLSHTIARLERKLETQRSEYAEAEQGDEEKRKGDLITANIWRIRRGDAALTAEDYSLDPPETVTVPLDPRLSPSANAQVCYKRYNKAKTARRVLTEQMQKTEEELRYLESVEVFLSRAECEQDFIEIREELWRNGYAKKMKKYTPPKQVKTRPLVYRSPSGYRVLVGRNNLQNEQLTFHTAGKRDLWFHAKGVPGSHVILVCDGEEPPAEDYTFAAQLAAYYSKAEGAQFPVDYTRVGMVKKPSGARPGFVIYHTNYTAYVEAALPKGATPVTD